MQIARYLLLVMVGLLLVAPATAEAGRGFGYGDPRSEVLPRLGSLAALPNGRYLIGVGFDPARVYQSEPDARLELVAGGGELRIGTEPVPARGSYIGSITEIDPAPGGGFMILAGYGGYVYSVKDGTIKPVAGTGVPGSTGDGGPAPAAQIDATGISVGPDGSYLLAEYRNYVIREVSALGTITTVAGSGSFGIPQDGQPALGNPMGNSFDAAFTPDGGFVYTEDNYGAIRKVEPDGTIATLAGGFDSGYGGDGGPAVDAGIGGAGRIEVADDGSILFTDAGRVRRIGTDGIIDTVAGTGETTYNGDGIPATEANIWPAAISATDDGGLLISDRSGRVRKVSVDGIISTIAGIPAPEFCPQVRYSGHQGGNAPDEIVGSGLRDLIRGEAKSDEISGAAATDCISGGPGDDLIRGGPGDDTVAGDEGRDEVAGSGGDDTIVGGYRDDLLIGDRGDDRLFGGEGEDRLIGGEGDDYINARGDPPTVDHVRCGPGRDTVKANLHEDVAEDCETVRRGGTYGHFP